MGRIGVLQSSSSSSSCFALAGAGGRISGQRSSIQHEHDWGRRCLLTDNCPETGNLFKRRHAPPPTRRPAPPRPARRSSIVLVLVIVVAFSLGGGENVSAWAETCRRWGVSAFSNRAHPSSSILPPRTERPRRRRSLCRNPLLIGNDQQSKSSTITITSTRTIGQEAEPPN
jgi:hypothetical protein